MTVDVPFSGWLPDVSSQSELYPKRRFYYRAAHPTRTSFLGSNVLTSATYGPAGALQSYATRNGVTTAIAQDPSLLPRPIRISTSGASENLDTGTFTYDGAGNITAMARGLATDTFRYDVLGRLTSSSLSLAGGPYGDEFEYDGFHNLTRHKVSRNGSLQGDYAFATDLATNHLVGERYDPRGNLRTFEGTGLPAGADYMFYDRLDRMLGYGKSSSPAASQEEYLYDGTGERLVRVMAVSTLAVTTAALPDGYVGGTYAQALSATGGRLPYGWAYSGSLPPGLQLDAGGRLSGVATQSGSFSFTLRVSDGTSIAYRSLSVTIQGPPRFYTLTPCRLLDTRNPNGALGGPRLGWSGDDAQRAFPAAGACGIPAHATAIAVNVTTVNEAGGSGWVKAFPAGLPTAPAATVTAYVPRRPVRATQAMIGLNGPIPGWFVLRNEPLQGQAAAPIQVIVDVSGYFAPASPASGRPVEASAPSGLSAPTTPRSPLAAGGVWYFTFRNGAKKPTAEYEQSTLTRDSFYLGNLLVATAEYASGAAWKFYSSDHLGTPRLVTNSTGTVLEKRSYRPYGLTLDVFSPPARGFGFAGMEREASNLSTQASFDHARQVSSWTGRFQAVDSANGRIDDPMSWNRYTYGRNNPLKYVDPDGREVKYANEHLQRVFTRYAARDARVSATLQRYTGAGKPDLTIMRGDAGRDRSGARAFGAFKAGEPGVNFRAEYDWTKMSDNSPVLHQSGKHLASAEFLAGTIIIDSSLVEGSKGEANVAIHELGHADFAARAILDFLKLGADDMETSPDGKALPHDDRPLEKDAIEYRDNVCGVGKDCPGVR